MSPLTSLSRNLILSVAAAMLLRSGIAAAAVAVAAAITAPAVTRPQTSLLVQAALATLLPPLFLPALATATTTMQVTTIPPAPRQREDAALPPVGEISTGHQQPLG